LYGLLKITVAITALFLPNKARDSLKDNRYLKYIITQDTTLAAKIIEISLLIFGVYSLVTALHMLGYIHVPLITSRTFIYSFYTLVGLVLIAFYYIVLYTEFPVSKNEDEMLKYRIIGFVGGFTFLITTLIYFVYHQVLDHGWSEAFIKSTTLVALLGILSIIAMIYHIIKGAGDNEQVKKEVINSIVILKDPQSPSSPS
jgi:hypothetical protein